VVGQIVDGPCQHCQEFTRIAEHCLSVSGQADKLGVPIKQSATDGVFERTHLNANSRLGQMESPYGSREITCFRYGDQSAQPLWFKEIELDRRGKL
jgi:hypothetical protein